MSALIFCASCGQIDAARIAAAGRTVGEARALPVVADTLARLPAACTAEARAGVRAGDGQAAAVLAYDVALALQIARTRACAAYAEDLRRQLATQVAGPQ